VSIAGESGGCDQGIAFSPTRYFTFVPICGVDVTWSAGVNAMRFHCGVRVHPMERRVHFFPELIGLLACQPPPGQQNG
jgi:hypothetical protein